MKIDRSKLNEIYGSQATNASAASGRSASDKNGKHPQKTEADSLKITDEAKLQTGIAGIARRAAAKAAKQAPAERLLRLKAEIAGGTYQASSEEIAKAICGPQKEKE